MLFLKSLLFLPANMLVAFLIVFLIRQILFYPRKEILLTGKKMPLTPGLVVKYHKLLVEKINDLVFGYLHDVDSEHEGNRVDNWEDQVFEKCYNWLDNRINLRFVPEKAVTAIKVFLAEVGREFARQFLRSFVPYLLETYNITNYIDRLKSQFTIEFLQGYYDRYVFKYSLYFMLGLGLIIGITNQIIYLIIGG